MQIYNFLVRLPADSGFIKSLADPTASYKDIFPRGQPFRSLYAIHALFEYKNLAARAASCAIIQDMPLEHDGQLEAESTAETEAETGGLSYSTARERSVALILRAILDPDVVANTNARLELELTSSLMHILMQWLQESGLVTPIKLASAGVLAPPDRFIDILSNAVDSEEDTADSLAVNTFSVLLRLGLQDAEFWSLLARNEDFERVMCDMMLFGRQCKIRPVIYRIIQDATVNEVRLAERQPHSLSEQAMADNEVTESQKQQEHQQYRISLHFWKLALDLLPQVEEHADRCCDLFDLMFSVACRLSSQKPGLIDLPAVASMASELLLLHVPTESVDQPEKFDPVPRGLVSLLEICLQLDHTVAAKTGTNIAPIAEALPEHLAYDMFWNLLFPRARDSAEDPVPKVVLHGVTRQKVCDVIYRLVHNDRERFRSVLESMNEVLPHHVTTDDDTPYLYDIPLSFDRQKALRAPCGYVGLRNLSNTCYLNSLMTQLYMNPAFREFILSAEILDEPPTRQKLLLNTKKLFGFMQESYRRFVDPIDFVDSIMTYDNTHIDVTAQMDVDEFYNLLFDRWESQLLGRGISGGSQTASLKNKLRSFYGGQLVQQVKSMECGHISERLEPFSAIQCDVQGKSGLQDSLQAYVDGEVLEGGEFLLPLLPSPTFRIGSVLKILTDNKYKCSSCDRHVDAVKR